ncbi:hypothetical protein [uncultured Kordia sp.]|uniref:hypothetical protein n=1 Tax=uncultured Kordia sp. TaxID=507699 RepID=UPI002627D04E|nr:hypothetical protein [uncultured Kordia sp.]
MNTNINIATKNLYGVFKPYTIEGNLRERSCDCCVSDAEIKELLSKDLHVLSEDEIGHFMRSAVTTFGCVTDYKHFLPRILELMQFENSDMLFDFTTYEKLNYSKWETWSESEIEAIKTYFTTLWIETLNDTTTTLYKTQSMLKIMITYVGWDATFSIWEKAANSRWIHYVVDVVLGNDSLDFNTEDTERLMNWFSTHLFLSKLENAFLETEDKLEANRISIAYTILEKYNKN